MEGSVGGSDSGRHKATWANGMRIQRWDLLGWDLLGWDLLGWDLLSIWLRPLRGSGEERMVLGSLWASTLDYSRHELPS